MDTLTLWSKTEHEHLGAQKNANSFSIWHQNKEYKIKLIEQVLLFLNTQ